MEDDVYAHTAPQARRKNSPPRFASQVKPPSAAQGASDDDESEAGSEDEQEEGPQVCLNYWLRCFAPVLYASSASSVMLNMFRHHTCS